jgi:transcriptional regulator with GAF, ATPase, and Fis domain
LSDSIQILDHASSNGTFVAGRRIEAETPTTLEGGKVFELGTVVLTVHEGRDDDACVEAPQSARGTDATTLDEHAMDPQMRRVHDLVDLVSQSNLSVILYGETGVGKEVLASRVHAHSTRRDKPFVKVNCAALVETLLEAELFGHERGAFTGAVQQKAGLLEAADGGTLLLDEVGELPLTTQAKLLRVLESGEVTRVGAVKARNIDVRFVSATHRNLRELVDSGKFREDLLFRLDGVSIVVPPLRDRPADIARLARAFLADVVSSGAPAAPVPTALTEASLARLRAHPWRGNVRELRNVIRRSALLCRAPNLDAGDLHFDSFVPSAKSQPLRREKPEAQGDGDTERRQILDALEKTTWNQTRAAELLGISRARLLKRLDALGIPRPRKR